MKRCSLTGGFDKQTERLTAIFTVTAYLETILPELETYKKIVEKLEKTGCGDVSIEHCRKYGCDCKRCFLDWAKNEVENEK